MKITKKRKLQAKWIIQISALLVILIIGSCSKEKFGPSIDFEESVVNVGAHKLKAFYHTSDHEYLVVFESGLGDDHGVWNVRDVTGLSSMEADILLYDRAGYGGSDYVTTTRGIKQLSDDLAVVIDEFANGRQVILVGHSLGGMIIRNYAIQNPMNTAALLFVDTSHEQFNTPSQADEDQAVKQFKDTRGSNFGGVYESKQLVENIAYMSSLPNLPNVPVVVLTSMKTDKQNDAETKQRWDAAHETLKEGIEDFAHIRTTSSGHYIMLEEANLVIDNIKLLVSKLQ